MSDQRQESGLGEVREHAVKLLGELKFPPHRLRIQAGATTLDITWADGQPTRAAPGPIPAGEATRPDDARDVSDRAYVTSPAVGVFYCASEPGAEPFVSLGSVVEPGQQVGIVEVMKLMIPVEAASSGRVAEVLKANGDAVEYGEALFAIELQEAAV